MSWKTERYTVLPVHNVNFWLGQFLHFPHSQPKSSCDILFWHGHERDFAHSFQFIHDESDLAIVKIRMPKICNVGPVFERSEKGKKSADNSREFERESRYLAPVLRTGREARTNDSRKRLALTSSIAIKGNVDLSDKVPMPHTNTQTIPRTRVHLLHPLRKPREFL
jgi:hypothetical protein